MTECHEVIGPLKYIVFTSENPKHNPDDKKLRGLIIKLNNKKEIENITVINDIP